MKTSGSAPVSAGIHELAFLAGGPGRVVDTTIVGLRVRGLLLVAREGRLTATARVGEGPIEDTILDLVPAESGADLTEVRLAAAGAPAILAMRDELVAAGLLRRASRPFGRRAATVTPAGVRCLGAARREWGRADWAAEGPPDVVGGAALFGRRGLHDAETGAAFRLSDTRIRRLREGKRRKRPADEGGREMYDPSSGYSSTFRNYNIGSFPDTSGSCAGSY
ncbi:TIGR04222 domain-containing membrane protein [Embleya sp. MST-111070]|uniref:TIGR04222 domain-containing membrane protein n=1 Tax=Embleya sp. MST-111070 TaxID=3398231 RepID=UPI003F73CC65